MSINQNIQQPGNDGRDEERGFSQISTETGSDQEPRTMSAGPQHEAVTGFAGDNDSEEFESGEDSDDDDLESTEVDEDLDTTVEVTQIDELEVDGDLEEDDDPEDDELEDDENAETGTAYISDSESLGGNSAPDPNKQSTF